MCVIDGGLWVLVVLLVATAAVVVVVPLARSCRPAAPACVLGHHVTRRCNRSAAGTAVFRHTLKLPLATGRLKSQAAGERWNHRLIATSVLEQKRAAAG